MSTRKTLFTLFGIGELNARLVSDGKETHVEIFASLPAGRLEQFKKRLEGSKIPRRTFLKKRK